MASRLYAHVLCDGCSSTHPHHPAVLSKSGVAHTTINALRAEARLEGWETMRGKHGRDLCPRCRIAEIQQQSALREEESHG